MSVENKPNENRTPRQRPNGARSRSASGNRSASASQAGSARSSRSASSARARTTGASSAQRRSSQASQSSKQAAGRGARSSQRAAGAQKPTSPQKSRSQGTRTRSQSANRASQGNSRARTQTANGTQRQAQRGSHASQHNRAASRPASQSGARRSQNARARSNAITPANNGRSRGKAPVQNAKSMRQVGSNSAVTTMNSGSILDKVRSNPMPLVAIVVAVILVFAFFTVLNNPKIYRGVTVGDLDVSGMTKEEAITAISEYYSPRVENASITIYAGDEGREKAQSGQTTDIGPEEQLSVEDVAANTTSWKVSNTDVGAYIDASSLAEKAYQVGRDNGGFFTRLGSFIFGTKVSADSSFDESSLEQLATKIDSTMGYSRVDWNIAVTDGHAYVTEGSDGLMTNRDTLRANLSNAFTSANSVDESFTAYVENTPVRISESVAQQAADTVNEAIADGASFTYESTSWTCSASEVGDWVSATVTSENGSWTLKLGIRRDSLSADFFSHVQVGKENSGLAVSFEVDGDNVTVHTNSEGTMPQVEPARAALEKALFDNGGKKSTGTPAQISVESGPIPESMTFDEALESGIITQVSSYTTEYTTGDGTEARNTNIHIGASYINNSVAKANGEEWSFNDLVGDTTPDKGYQAAGSIAQGEYVDTYGGGICQVATTVFNALFESPYKITKRYNHSLYIASYPTGRDAAISWGMLDLTWQNETNSDVLLQSSCTDDSITVALYSTPCTFKVTSDVGDWEEGEKYVITVQYDENMSKGYSYVKQAGADGSKITVVRTVYDGNGNIMYSNTFASTYLPKDEIIVAGPGTEVNTERTDAD